MPKSKRDKKISLTRTQKKCLESKQRLVEEIRKCLDKYSRLFVFSVEHMRSSKINNIRIQWKHNSRFFMGKNRVMALALGRVREEEIAENLCKISVRLVGQRGILFTNATKEEILEFFDNFHDPDYARCGDTATETVELDEGPLEHFPHSLEPQLRQLGLPVQLKRGIPTLLKQYTICKKGDVLKTEQAKLLKLFGITMAHFHLKLECMWERLDGTFTDFGRGSVIRGKEQKLANNRINSEERANNDDADEEVSDFSSDDSD